MLNKSKKAFNFAYFHRKRLAVFGGFTTLYGTLCYKSKDSKNEIYKMGMAGSLANLAVEVGFHFVDTVNVRTKVSDTNMSSSNMVKHIYSKEGISGFTKGFSACYYGSAACGFIYFSLYKLFK